MKLGPRRRTPPELTYAKLHDVHSRHCGIITDLERFEIRERGPKLYGYGATVEVATTLGYARFRQLRGSQSEIWRTGAAGRGGSRVAFDRTRAFVRTVGEGLERYACCTYDPGAFVRAPWIDVRERALDPRECQRPTKEEYSHLPLLAPFDPAAPMRWANGWSLRDKTERLVPAQDCYVMYNTIPGEPRLAGNTSTGWALHHTPEEAIQSALREVVERDSFMITWLHRLPVPTLDLDSIDMPDVKAWLADLDGEGSRARVLVTTTDFGIPSFAVAASDSRPGRPAFHLTLAAHPDPRRGLRQAVEEAAMTRLDLTYRVREGLVKSRATMEEITEMQDHAEYYLDPSHLAPLEWLLRPTPSIRLDEIPSAGSDDVWSEVTTMVDGIAKAGYDTLYVDTTPPDLREAGWAAAKALVPGSVRHEYGHGVRYLNCPRIYDAPARMGHARGALNLDAHPYS